MEKHEVIICILNKGFADTAMDAARAAGARGGTVLHGRGTAAPEAEKLFNISIHPEKEIILILTSLTIRDAVLKALYDRVGSATDAQGFVFTLPVEQVAGLHQKKKPSGEKEKTESDSKEVKKASKKEQPQKEQ